MVAQAVEVPVIDRLIGELGEAVKRAAAARSKPQQVAREAVAIRIGDELHAAWLALEAELCGQRDWIDAHRRDAPPDPRFAARWDEFWSETVRQHAEAGAALQRAAGTLTWRS